jgi:hypothetical protein
MALAASRKKSVQGIISGGRSRSSGLRRDGSFFPCARSRLEQLRAQGSGGDGFGMPVSQSLRADRKRMLGESDGLAQPTLLLPQQRQLMQRLSRLRMLSSSPKAIALCSAMRSVLL